MRTWPALIAAPVLALADQSAAYALVGWSCAHQQPAALHVVHAVFLLATVLVMIPGWIRMRPGLGRAKGDEGVSGDRGPMMGMVAFFVALLSAWVIVAMWVPLWALSPCHG